MINCCFVFVWVIVFKMIFILKKYLLYYIPKGLLGLIAKMTTNEKCQYCSTHAKSVDEISSMFGYKANGVIYMKCVRCRETCEKWRQNNKEELNEKQKEYSKTYYDNHKEKVIAQQSEK